MCIAAETGIQETGAVCEITDWSLSGTIYSSKEKDQSVLQPVLHMLGYAL